MSDTVWVKMIPWSPHLFVLFQHLVHINMSNSNLSGLVNILEASAVVNTDKNSVSLYLLRIPPDTKSLHSATTAVLDELQFSTVWGN